MEDFSPVFPVHVSDGKKKCVHSLFGQREVDLFSLFLQLSRVYEGSITVEGFLPGEEERNLQETFRVVEELHHRLPVVSQ